MTNEEIDRLVHDLNRLHVMGCPAYKPAAKALIQMKAYQEFVSDLVKHHQSPGSPEKTAEHYQIVHRAKALKALI